MVNSRQVRLPLVDGISIRSLCWHGDALVDWAAGGVAYGLDNRTWKTHWDPAYDRLDAATVSQSQKYAVIYELLGTKGLVLGVADLGTQPKWIRQINRSLDHADRFVYPVVLFQLPDGREALAHCPDGYNRLVIEDTVTGERIAESTCGEPLDYFYSRLAVSPSGRRLLSGGWFWQPCDMVLLYDVQSVLQNPDILDTEAAILITPTEISDAAFLDDDRLVISSSSDPDYEEADSWLPRRSIALYDLSKGECVVSAQFEEPIGMVMPLNERLAVSFYGHPKLIDMERGSITHRWEDIDSGKQESGIIGYTSPPPPVAADPKNGRFAVAAANAITVIEITI